MHLQHHGIENGTVGGHTANAAVLQAPGPVKALMLRKENGAQEAPCGRFVFAGGGHGQRCGGAKGAAAAAQTGIADPGGIGAACEPQLGMAGGDGAGDLHMGK